MSDGPGPIISLRGVKKRFAAGPPKGAGPPAEPKYVVNGVDLDVYPGQLLVLLGGSGCGKTTTLKMINRLEEPTEGTIVVRVRKDGGWEDIWPIKDPVRLRRKIGYVIQESGLLPHMTVGDNIGLVPRLLGWPKDEIDARVAELLAVVGLEEKHRGFYPHELSGGMRQRVGFARAVAARPPVMLLDEPFGALDPLKREEVRAAFRRIREKERLTAVMVTHDMTEALLLADRIAVMNEGQVVQCDAPRVLLTEPANEYVRQFIQGPLEETRLVEKLRAGAPAGGGQ